MQTFITDQLKDTPAGREADAILRSCVHCGFCTAVCPTYLQLGDELDGPRGRIYLIKQALEGAPVTAKTQLHLDRCLTCRACETACPSGVQYARLAEIGRDLVDEHVPRSLGQRLLRRVLRAVLTRPGRFAAALRLGRAVGFVLPDALRRKLPAVRAAGERPHNPHTRKVLLLEGCVQPAATPRTNAAAARVLDRLGIAAESPHGAGCCGAISHHMGAHKEGLSFMRRNIDAWWPHVEAGAEAVVSAASACSLMIKDYAAALKDDPDYASKAAVISEKARDLSEVIAAADTTALQADQHNRRVAFHAPCSLQHGHRLTGGVEAILSNLGYRLARVRDAHLCCGSAGTYSLLQPELSESLLADKLDALEAEAPQVIATANVGCQLHLQTAARVPVLHWIELVDAAGR
jgi:glycolate oxidase iron-sulfur subunit